MAGTIPGLFENSSTVAGSGVHVIRALSVRRMRDALGESLSGAGIDHAHHESLARRWIAGGHSSARYRNQRAWRRSVGRHLWRALAGRFIRWILERGRHVHALLSRLVL